MKVCRRPITKSTRKITVQAGFEGKVGAEGMDLDILQRQMNQLRSEGEGNAVSAGDFGGVEEEKFVDDAGGERGAVEGAARFE